MLEMKRKTVVILGASGTVGEVVVDALAAHHELILIDKKYNSKLPVKVLDIANLEEFLTILPAADALIHLAATPQEDTQENLFHNNIRVTFNAFEAARIKGIKRFIFVSSIMTYGDRFDHKKPAQPLHPRLHTHPTTHYAVSKLYGEQLGRMYATRFGLSVICIRLGWFPRIPTTEEHLVSSSPLLISPQDCKRLFQASLLVEGVDYTIVNGLSRGGKDYYDLDITRQTLDFYPNDDLEETIHKHRVRLGFTSTPKSYNSISSNT